MSKKLFENELIAAPFSPMDAMGSVDTGKIPDYVEHLLKRGVRSVFICGTTGESTSLSLDERKKLAETWVSAASGRIKIMVHIGGVSMPDARELAKHAQRIGCTAVSSIAPVFIKAASAADLVSYFQEVLEEAGEIPFYYYHIPSMTGVQIPVAEFLKEAEGKLPTLTGIKYTHNDLMDMLACINYKDQYYEVLNGFDEILLAGLATGATGAVGSTYNYIPEIYQAVISAYQQNDYKTARQYQQKSVEVVRLLNKYGGIRTGKALLAHCGLDCGQVRPPLMPLRKQELEELYHAFDQIVKK